MTVKEAAIEILRGADRPLTVDEILCGIKERDLYQFRSQGHRGIVASTMKRNAEGAHSCSPAKTKVFRLVSSDCYELITS